MLRSEHSIVRYDQGQAIPDRLLRKTHEHYLSYARRMLAVYQSGIGRTRRELHRSIENVLGEEPDCHRRRIASFCKILDDAGEFETDRRGQAAALRLQVFTAAARFHPLVSQTDQIFEHLESDVKTRISIELGKPWETIDNALYADVIDRQLLREFAGLDSPESLLSRYNLSQLQACLYRAKRMTVDVQADFAAIVRYAKLARLLVNVRHVSNADYRLELSGPASVLQETRRYGVNFARFIAALTACQGWSMSADVLTPWNTSAHVRVTSADGYKTHVPAPQLFDSKVEEMLANDWGESRNGWRLVREAGILQQGQTTFVPDFLLRHEGGREVFLEIVGFWTPEYLAAKRKTISLFSKRRILLAIPKRSMKSDVDRRGIVVYKTRIDPDRVAEAAQEASDW